MTLGIDRIQSRRGTFAVGPVSASLEAGECLALIGVNGAGKTTLLETLAGFFPVVSGRVLLDGSDITARPPERRRMAYLPQDLALFPHLNVIQNVAFATRHRQRGWRREADALVAEFGLEAIGAHYPHQLSRGQAQRVALARALAARPAVLLLDEPAANLDVAGRRSFRATVRRLLVERGSTIVYATHDILDSLALASRLVVLDRGHVVQAGSPDALFRAPASAHVAELLGITNLWPAEILGMDDSTVRIRTGGCELRCMAQAVPREPVWVAIGPGEMELLAATPTDTTNCIKAVIRCAQFEGRATLLELEGGPGTIHAAAPSWRTWGNGVGQVVWVRLPAERLRLIPVARG